MSYIKRMVRIICQTIGLISMKAVSRPSSLVERVVDSIRDEIRTGRLQSGHRLPTEYELAEKLEVSRSVVREAVSQLKADGVLISRRGDGSYISDTPAGQVFRLPDELGKRPDIVQMFEMRLWLETQAAGVAAARRRPSDLARMSAAINAMDQEPNDYEASSAADIEFHRAIVEACGNSYINAFHDFLGSQLVQMRCMAWENSARTANGSVDAQCEHKALYDAIRDGNPGLAIEAAGRHLEAAASRFGIQLEIELPRGVSTFSDNTHSAE